MTSQESFEEKYPYWTAAQEAAKTVTPGNELQEAAASAIKGLAFDMELRRAFPEVTKPIDDTQAEVVETAAASERVTDSLRDIHDINAVREALPLKVSLNPDELASE